MRVTNDLIHDRILDYIYFNKAAVFDLQSQLASGKRVQRPSDDPASYDLISRLRDQDSTIKQFVKNDQRLGGKLLQSDTLLTQCLDLLKRASEVTVSAGDSSKTAQDRQAMAEEIDQILEEVVLKANSNPDESYLFSGLRSNTPPYAVARNADGRIATVAYSGSTETGQVEIGPQVYVPATLVGSDPSSDQAVFQSKGLDIFADLINLRDRLLRGDNPSDSGPITGADPATDIINLPAGLITGTPVQFTNDAQPPAFPGGIEGGRTYYAIWVGDGQIRLADSLANAQAGIAIDITSAGTGSTTIIPQHMANIDAEVEHVVDVLTRIGAYEERVDLNLKWLRSNQENTMKDLEEEESVDMAKAVMDLSTKQTAYEASLQMATQMLQQSILNYL